ncbi:G-protein coupled receptor Mth-like isoform X1 [Diorhabda carinulata]|uniref:G-protein coupled receptor Mth-like isoform X1 n=1 Tax=Diorhabda carinulata TaxID=1163345 RepID=UPI0025A2AE5D|nr:G-protein coupled receptor Mth-like isoform X1 [Diorhabda carinulata]
MKYLDTFVNNFVFVIILMSCEGQQVNITNDTQVMIIPPIPKCCPSKSQKLMNRHCMETHQNISLTHFFFESNITHINSDKREVEFEFYHRKVQCPAVIFTSEEIVGFIYNASIIDNSSEPVRLIPSSDYCVDSSNESLTFVVCYPDVDVSKAQFYFPCLILSTACYFISAVVYQFILKVKDVYKKCFIGFCISMGVTFFCLILFQFVNTNCVILGSIFFLFILASFLWFSCLCLEVMFTVREFSCEDMSERIYLYIATSIVVPCLILVISIIPTRIPDVPTSFMKEVEMCKFKGDNTRIAILFVPMGLLLATSLASLIYTFYLIAVNSKKYKSDIVWLEKRSHFKYRTRSCFMIWLTSAIWFIDAVLKNHNHGNPLVYEVIEGLQGIFVVAVFVTNRYTRKEIYQSLCGKEKRKTDSTRFKNLLEKFKTDKSGVSTSNATEIEN